jgi:hypothetical protein
MIYALNLKNYTNYTTSLMQNKFRKKHKKKFRDQILKLLNYKGLLIDKKTLILKTNQINFVKNQKKRCVFYLCVIFPN